MNLFKTFRLTWRQAVLFKTCLIALGIAIGAHWAGFFSQYLGLLLIVALIAGFYVVSIWWRQ